MTTCATTRSASTPSTERLQQQRATEKDFASAATAKGYAEDLAPTETAKADQRLQIAVMIRSDVFRELRARKKNSTPGPVEFFHVVNRTVAQHLADVPVALPDLTEVLAGVAATADFVRGRL